MYSQYLGFVYCGILLVLAVRQGYLLRILLRILPFSQYFGVGYSGILSALEVFKDPGLLMLLSTRSISAFSTAITFNTREYFRISYCEVQEYSQYFRVLYSEVLLVRVLLGVFYSNAEVFRGLILSILRVLPSILDFGAAGTACTRAFVLLILPVLAVFGPSVLLILQILRVFRPPVL